MGCCCGSPVPPPDARLVGSWSNNAAAHTLLVGVGRGRYLRGRQPELSRQAPPATECMRLTVDADGYLHFVHVPRAGGEDEVTVLDLPASGWDCEAPWEHGAIHAPHGVELRYRWDRGADGTSHSGAAHSTFGASREAVAFDGARGSGGAHDAATGSPVSIIVNGVRLFRDGVPPPQSAVATGTPSAPRVLFELAVSCCSLTAGVSLLLRRDQQQSLALR